MRYMIRASACCMLEKARPATFVTGRSSGGVSGVYDRHAYLAALRYAVSKCKRWAKAVKRALIEAASGPCSSRYTLQPMTAQLSCCTGLFALVLVAGSVALPDKTPTSKAVSEIHQLFVQDQKDRGVGAPALSSYEEMNSNDEKRRTRVHELLNSGALKSVRIFMTPHSFTSTARSRRTICWPTCWRWLLFRRDTVIAAGLRQQRSTDIFRR
jgi:hypothetical protein